MNRHDRERAARDSAPFKPRESAVGGQTLAEHQAASGRSRILTREDMQRLNDAHTGATRDHGAAGLPRATLRGAGVLSRAGASLRRLLGRKAASAGVDTDMAQIYADATEALEALREMGLDAEDDLAPDEQLP
jgi:hypothetical protein